MRAARSADQAAAEPSPVEADTGLSDGAVLDRVRAGEVNAVPAAPGRTISQIVRASGIITAGAAVGVAIAALTLWRRTHA